MKKDNSLKKLEQDKIKEMKDLEKQLEKFARQKAKEPGKTFGRCESCDFKTVLVKKVGLCGPCCFGESETVNGNW